MSSHSDAAAPAAPPSSAMLEAVELAASMVDDCMEGYGASISSGSDDNDHCPNDAMMMMMSMEQLLDDAGVTGGGDPSASRTPSKATAINITLAPSIVSGTTDLFEGDLCDDELDGTLTSKLGWFNGTLTRFNTKDYGVSACHLPHYNWLNVTYPLLCFFLFSHFLLTRLLHSINRLVYRRQSPTDHAEIPSILMSNGSKGGYYENLQLNPVELVEEVQEQVAQVAASDPEHSDGRPGTALVPTPAIATSSTAPGNTSQKRPVVPFVVRKLSDAEAVGIDKKRPSSSAAASLSKKARVSTAIVDKVVSSSDAGSSKVIKEEPSNTTRMTRSRAKKAPPAKKGKPEAVSSKNFNTVVPQKATTAAVKPNITRADTKDIVKLSVSAGNDHTVGNPNSSGNTSPTDEVIAAGKARDLPVVTPVETDKTVSAKQLSVQNKMESVGSITLPALYTASTIKAGAPAATTSKTGVVGVAKGPPEKEDIAGGNPPPVTATLKVTPIPSKRSSRRSSKVSNTSSPAEPPVPVDTSTAHIQALTRENGASVCLSIRSCTILASSLDAAEEAATKTAKATTATSPTETSPTETVKTEPDSGEDLQPPLGQSHMTEQERAQQSRDRNRKHARNTRLRKKAYVEELKQTLNELVIQRERAASEQQQNRQREVDQREVRFRVIEEFLKLRGRNESDVSRWTAILAPTFSFSLPRTPFQEMVDGEESKDRVQTLSGVEKVMSDSACLSSFLQTLGGFNRKSKKDEEETDAKKVSLVYCCDRKDFMMDGCNAVLGWNALSLGAIAKVCFGWCSL